MERLSGEKFEVVRLTNDLEIIKNYHDIGNNYTPIRVSLLVLGSGHFYCFFILS